MPGITTLSKKNFNFSPKTAEELKASADALAKRIEENHQKHRVTGNISLRSPRGIYEGSRKMINFVIPTVLLKAFKLSASTKNENFGAAICRAMEMYIDEKQ